MSAKTTLVHQLVPALLVRDMAETLEFYRRLGFLVTGADPAEPAANWGEVQRDGVSLMFHTVPPHGTPPTPICSGTFYIRSQSVASLAEEFRGVVEFAWGPEVMDYGTFEFGIQDPNGYYVAFAEPADR